jgi:hypothetical protein
MKKSKSRPKDAAPNTRAPSVKTQNKLLATQIRKALAAHYRAKYRVR